MSDRLTVTSGDFIRNIGFWQSEALRQPVVITHHGRARLVLAAPENFEQSAMLGRAQEPDPGFAELRNVHAALVDHLDEGLLVLDAELRVCSANRVALAFCGQDADAVHAQALLDIVPQPLASVLCDRAQRVHRARKSETLEASTFDGRQLSVRVFPIGEQTGILFHNVTETVLLRRKLEEGDALAASLAHHSHAAAIKLDGRARIAAIDGCFCTISGFAAADVIGHRFVDLVSPQQRRATAELIEGALRERATGEIALTLLGRRGDEHPGLFAAAPITTDFVAHGVMGVWTPIPGAESLETAAA